MGVFPVVASAGELVQESEITPVGVQGKDRATVGIAPGPSHAVEFSGVQGQTARGLLSVVGAAFKVVEDLVAERMGRACCGKDHCNNQYNTHRAFHNLSLPGPWIC